jgi:uncharacterized membrane protein
MSLEADTWLRIGHILGFVTWIGGMIATLTLLRIHSVVEGAARDVLGRHEHRTAMLMDLGATLAIACGLSLALGRTPIEFKTGAWLHVKLTIVVLGLFSMHGFTRAQVKKFKRGKIRHVSSGLIYLLIAIAAAIIVLGAHPTLLRK